MCGRGELAMSGQSVLEEKNFVGERVLDEARQPTHFPDKNVANTAPDGDPVTG